MKQRTGTFFLFQFTSKRFDRWLKYGTHTHLPMDCCACVLSLLGLPKIVTDNLQSLWGPKTGAYKTDILIKFKKSLA